jgi:hypothetical protein
MTSVCFNSEEDSFKKRITGPMLLRDHMNPSNSSKTINRAFGHSMKSRQPIVAVWQCMNGVTIITLLPSGHDLRNLLLDSHILSRYNQQTLGIER